MRTRIHNVLLSCNTYKRRRLLPFLCRTELRISFAVKTQTVPSVVIIFGMGLRVVRTTPLILLTNVLENLNQYQSPL